MMGYNHIVDRIAIALVLTGLVLASAGIGAFGLAAVTSQTDTSQALGAGPDGATLFAFPINNVTGSSSTSAALAFPINNVTGSFGTTPALAFPIDNFSALQITHRRISSISALVQDMGPYALALGQDMDPY